MEKKIDLGRERMGKAIEEIGVTGIHIDEALLTDARKILLEKGYEASELFISQSTASLEHDELLRVLKICEQCQLNPELSTEVLKNLNMIESGNW
ncbi:MAG: hypothetical protein MUO26_09210 [Methanotrichaceae archaeon]|nr:hypothetical protein [Methanotrichaceae archaeon]